MIRRSRPQVRRRRLQVEVLEAKQLLATMVVTTTADSGAGSLRQAILDIDNSTLDDSEEDTIDFAIPGAGVQTIAPTTPLPVINRPINIDATTQPGYAGSPLIVLDGVNAVAADGAPVIGLDLDDTGDISAYDDFRNSVQGLGIIRFSGTGLQDNDGSSTISDLVIGTDVAGGQNLGNGGFGIDFGSNGVGTIVGIGYGNVVTNCVIENNGLRAIGQLGDQPDGQSSDPAATSGLTEANNDTQATALQVSTPSGDRTALNAQWRTTQTLTYTITNTGSIAATDVNLDVKLQTDDSQYGYFTVAGATTTQGTVGVNLLNVIPDNPIFASLGTLAPGASATLTVTIDLVAVNAAPASASSGIDPTDAGSLTVAASAAQVDYDPRATSASYLVTGDSGDQTPSPTDLTTPVTTSSPNPPSDEDPTSPVATGVGTLAPVATTTATIEPPSAMSAASGTADLAVSATSPVEPQVGTGALFLIKVANVGTGVATDAVAEVDLGAIPAGSFYAIESQASTGGSGTLTPVAGQAGVYLVDLGPIAAGAAATVAVLVNPTTVGPIGIAVAASDAPNPAADLNPANNLAIAGAVVAPTDQVADVEVSSARTIQLNLNSAVTKAQADNLVNYHLTTATTADATSTPVRLSLASYDATDHRVTLRLAHPMPVTAKRLRLTITGLGATGDSSTTTLDWTRSGLGA